MRLFSGLFQSASGLLQDINFRAFSKIKPSDDAEQNDSGHNPKNVDHLLSSLPLLDHAGGCPAGVSHRRQERDRNRDFQGAIDFAQEKCFNGVSH
jgi:hypothetical protein